MNTRADELLLEFISVDGPTLAVMHAHLLRERDEASADGSIVQTHHRLCVAANVIGHLRFPDAWDGAKANAELKQVA